MSISNGRRKLSNFLSRFKKEKRKRVATALRLESLENRQMMAGDVSPHHNTIWATDVNRDFVVSPLDALLIINDLNIAGTRKLDAGFDPSKGGALLDVNNDGNVSPSDLLRVINALNLGEGVGELVEFKYEFVDLNGNSLDPNPGDNVTEFQVSLGSTFRLRTSVRDLRGTPSTVYSAFHDIDFVNQDGGATEIAALQYGEFDLLRIESTTRSGQFALQFGTGATAQTTAPITVPVGSNNVIVRSQLATLIRSAVGALGIAGGEANVRVESLTRLDNADNTFFHFGISFIDGRARRNIADPSIASSTLQNASNNLSLINVEANNGNDPTDPEVALVALNFRMQTSTGGVQSPLYSNVPFARYANPSTGTFQLDQVGGVSTISAPPDEGADQFFRVFEATFVAERAGTVLVSGNHGEGPSTGGGELTLLGQNDPVIAANVIYPTNIPLRVVSGIQANPDTMTVAEDSGATVKDVSANDQLLNGTSFGVDAVNGETDGSVTIRDTNNVVAGTVTFTSGAKTISFTPAANYFGTVVFNYTAKSNLNATSTASVTATITPVNDAPVVTDRQFNTSQGVALTIAGSQVFSPGPANESAQTMTMTAFGGSPTGTVAIVSGSVRYTPAANFSGNDIFTVTGRDNGSPALSTTATITVTVDDVNDPPVPFTGPIAATEDTVLILIGTGAPTNILTSSSPGAGESNQTLTLVSISAASGQGGTVATTNGITRYTPPAEFSGTDTVVYTIRDNGTPALEATGTVTINVAAQNDPPNAVDDSGAGFSAIGISTEPTELFPLANDTSGDAGDTIRIISVGTPSLGGTVVIINNGQAVRYNPPAGQAGVNETFTYTIEDSGGARDTATVTVAIQTPSLPFARNNTASVAEDTTTPTVIDVMANDLFNNGATRQLLDFTQPVRGTTVLGTVTLVDNGTPADPSDDRLAFVPAENDFGTVTFTYRINDSAQGSQPATGTVTVNITEVNDAPVAIDRQLNNGTEDTTQTITGASLVAGLSKGATNESAQVLTVTNATAITSGGGTVAVQNGNVVYTPAPNFNGNFVFTYTVSDNGTTNGANDFKSSTATVTLAVAAVNDAPVVSNPTLTGSSNEDIARTIAISNLIANDRPGPATATDEATQNLTFVNFTGTRSTANGGTIQMSGDSQSLIYTPAANYFGPDSFTYTVTDDGTPAQTATSTASLTVAAVNDAPVSVAISQTANTGILKTFSIAPQVATMSPGPANESSQRVRLLATNGNSANGGTFTVATDGTITYRSAQNFSGSDTFSYTISDNGSPEATATGTVTIVVSPFVPSTISGVVWVDDRFGDSDRDGNRVEANELRLGGVQLNISGVVVGQADRFTDSVWTLADGSYSFDGLAPGTYTVTLVRPPLLINGPDYAGAQGDADSVEDSFTIVIAAPGPVNATNYNFSVLGVDPNYATGLDNLASSFYNAYPNLRQRGIYAAVNQDGAPIWSARKDGYADAEFVEVVLSNDGNQAIVTRVTKNAQGQHIISTANVARNRFVKLADGAGNTIIQVLQGSSDLSWTTTTLASISTRAKHYLSSVDKVFEQENW